MTTTTDALRAARKFISMEREAHRAHVNRLAEQLKCEIPAEQSCRRFDAALSQIDAALAGEASAAATDRERIEVAARGMWEGLRIDPRFNVPDWETLAEDDGMRRTWLAHARDAVAALAAMPPVQVEEMTDDQVREAFAILGCGLGSFRIHDDDNWKFNVTPGAVRRLAAHFINVGRRG